MQHFWLKSIRLLVVPPKHFLPVEAEDDEFPMRTKHTISFFQFSLVETEKTSDYNNEESRANRKKHHHILNTVLSTEYIEKDGRNFHNGTSWKVIWISVTQTSWKKPLSLYLWRILKLSCWEAHFASEFYQTSMISIYISPGLEWLKQSIFH